MHWVVHLFLYCFCLHLASAVGALERRAATLEWHLRRVECKANGMEWTSDKTYPEAGYCRTPDGATVR